MSYIGITLSDIYVQKGYEGASQAKFTPYKDTGRGTLHFKVSSKNKDDKYTNFSVMYNVSTDSKLISLINTPSVRVNVSGTLSQEEYQGNKFLSIRAAHVSVVRGSIPTTGQGTQTQQARQPEVAADPF